MLRGGSHVHGRISDILPPNYIAPGGIRLSSWHQVVGHIYLAPGGRIRLLGTRCQEMFTWHQVAGDVYLAPGGRRCLLGTQEMFTWHQMPGDVYLAPGGRRCLLGTRWHEVINFLSFLQPFLHLNQQTHSIYHVLYKATLLWEKAYTMFISLQYFVYKVYAYTVLSPQVQLNVVCIQIHFCMDI